MWHWESDKTHNYCLIKTEYKQKVNIQTSENKSPAAATDFLGVLGTDTDSQLVCSYFQYFCWEGFIDSHSVQRVW